MGVSANKCLSSRRGGPGVETPDFFFIFNTKSCILMHSLAPKMGTTSVLSIPLRKRIGEMKTVGRGPKIEAEGQERGGVLGEGQQAPPARGLGSTVSSPAGFGAEP